MADDKTTAQIDALLREDREFAAVARVCRACPRQRSRHLRKSRQGSRSVLGAVRLGARVEHALDEGARLEAAAREVVRRRQAQRERQLPRPPRPHVAQEQGGHHLGRRARREAHADLLGAVSRGLSVRQRPSIARRQERRPRRDLPAADPRAGDRDARLRAHRRGSQRRLRRLQRRVAARPHQRPAGAPADHRRRRLPPRQRRAVEARGRRSARRHAVDRERRRRPAQAESVRGRAARTGATTGITT